ncbi:MAG: hypothetical protein R3F61_37485 [Myxococcota bacterium]
MRLVCPLILFTCLVACGEEDDSAEDFAATLESDVEDLARVSTGVAVAQTTVSECVDTVGECRTCLEATGTPLSGTFTVGLESTPCSATWTTAAGETTYTVDSSAFAGSWTGGLSSVSVEMSGSRDATLETSRRRGDSTRTASMTLDALELEATLDGTVTSMVAELTYVGFGGRTYSVELADDGQTLSGTATAGSVTCTISGTRTAPVVDCPR